jgi:hypothetical protein
MSRVPSVVTASLLLAVVLPCTLVAQTDRLPRDGGTTYSLGMPPIWKGNAGGTFGWYDPDNVSELNALFHLGVSRDLLSPIAGIARIGVEGYLGARSGAQAEFDGGGRALFSIPSLHVGVGADYNALDNNTALLLRLELPMRRSGIFGRGTEVRIDWLPNRGNTFAVGINAPLWGRNIGKTRPQRDSFELDHPPMQRLGIPADRPAGFDEAVAQVRHSSRWIAEMSMPLLDHGGKAEEYEPEYTSINTHWATTDGRFPNGHTLNEEIRVYHEALERLFSIAYEDRDFGPGESSAEGRLIAQAARETLVDYLLLPYNRLLGQRKAHDGLDEFAASAHSEFSRWALPRSEIREDAFERVFYAFQTVTDIAEEVRVFQKDRWDDSRFVWLPMQMGLRPEDHDTEAEINSLIERGTQEQFQAGNRIWYTINEEFQLEFARSVRLAEDYHVLWIHDYRGKNSDKNPDEVGFRQTVNVYMQTLVDRVNAYDATGNLPQYFIFLDQNYFEANDTRLYFRILTDPLNADLDLPSGYEAWEQEFLEVQTALRDAVANSRLLQSERRQYGDDWLENQIKVQINITNPVDHSFLSTHVAGIIAVPDNVIRDHRKIAFYDVTEDDPYRGQSMYTGMGIGEHYAGRNWEDRALILQGPASLAVKDAARDLLLSQGFAPEEIPFPLRAKPKPENYETRVDSMVAWMESTIPGHEGKALELHNLTGYAPKPVNVKKALMYSLMPAGSLMKIPDSLWQSYLYGSLLMGSALRGCQVLVIVPSLASAPSSAAPTMARAHGLFSGMIVMKNALDAEIRSQGGIYKTGLYAPKVGVGDVEGRIRQAQTNSAPWLREVYPFNPSMRAAVDSVDTWLAEAGYQPNYLVNADSTEAPKLHMKANFFITGEAWDFVMQRPEWGPLLREYFQYLAYQTGPIGDRIPATQAPAPLREAALALALGVQADIPPEIGEHSFAYFTMGSTNLNYRSMVLDGEVEITITGWDTLSGLVDFLLIAGLSEWVEDLEHLDALLPPPGGMTRSIANLIKLLL